MEGVLSYDIMALQAQAKGVSLSLPIDVVIADKFATDSNSKLLTDLRYNTIMRLQTCRTQNLGVLWVVPASSIPDGWMGLDIGPDSIKTFNEALDKTQTIIWNGPMGVFEFDKFAVGTEV
ncbi:Phosphoglycerate kinase [Sesbania bispinosa]|nr:Phosphoglycerate kinase [Sesbania bispinosa]